ncbi:MAG: helix-turn-helix domain-containing protein [Actinobacteria bacterium]|nr:helix-turn-helix domain-containing protein [Actinomycetota bacterium]
MLQEMSVVEQRYLAVRKVLDGAKVTDVATRYGVDWRAVHRWLVRTPMMASEPSPTAGPGVELGRDEPSCARSAFGTRFAFDSLSMPCSPDH